MSPWLPMCLKWWQCYRSYRAEIMLVKCTPFECLDVHLLHPLSKICQKCPCTVSETIQQPLQLQSLPGWHMKNTGLSYLFCKMPSSISGLVWRLVRFKMACNTFQMMKTSISLVHDFEDHIHCLSPGVL